MSEIHNEGFFTTCSGYAPKKEVDRASRIWNQYEYKKLDWHVDLTKKKTRRFTMKKIIFGAVLAVVGLSGMGFGTGAFSYLSTAWNQATEAIEGEIPVEFQIERAKNILTQLQPEIKSTLLKVARKEIEYDNINERIAAVSRSVDESKKELMATDQISDKTRITYVSHKTNQSTLSSLEQLAALKLKTIEAGKKKLLQMSEAQTALRITIEELEVRNETLTLLQNEAGTFEDSAVLAEVQSIISSLTTRIGVAEKLLDIEGALNQEAASDTSMDAEIAAFIATKKDNLKIKEETQVAANEL